MAELKRVKDDAELAAKAQMRSAMESARGMAAAEQEIMMLKHRILHRFEATFICV